MGNKKIGFPVLTRYDFCQGSRSWVRAQSFRAINGAAKETVQPFALSLQTQQAEKKGKQRYTTEAIFLLSAQKADTRREVGSLSNVNHAHFE